MKHPAGEKTADRLEALALTYFPDLLPAERTFVRAATTPEGVDFTPEPPQDAKLLRDAKVPLDLKVPWVSAEVNADSQVGNVASGAKRWGHEREVRAKLIRWLCSNREAKALVDPRGIRLFAARITGELNLNFVEIPFLLALRRCRLPDMVSFVGAQIKEMDLDGSWTGPIDGDRALVTGNVWLDAGLRAEGMVSLVGAKIGGDLICAQDARFINKGKTAFYADFLTVGGSVLFRSWENLDDPDSDSKAAVAEGLVSFYGARIGGDLDFSGGQFFNEGKKALHLESADVKGKILLTSWKKTAFETHGSVDLRNAAARVFRDEEKSWPEPGALQLEGFVYGGFDADSPKNSGLRLNWLARDPTAGVQPYRQLAKVLLESGDSRGATEVLKKMESLVSASDSMTGRLLRASIGYGYQSSNAAWGLAALTLVGSLVTWRQHRMGMMMPTDKDAANAFKGNRTLPDHYPSFQPLIFSLENTFPLVKLGQVDKWQPDPAPAGPKSARLIRWFIWAQVLLGWLLATLFLAGMSGIVRHIQ